MKNRFNLNESEKNRIRTLHGIKPINEQKKPQPTVTYDPNTSHKYTRQEWLDAFRAAEPYVEKLLLGKTINLYEAVLQSPTSPATEGELLTWDEGPVKVRWVNIDIPKDGRGGLTIGVTGKVADPNTGDALSEREFQLKIHCGDSFFTTLGPNDKEVEFIRSNPMKGLGGSHMYPTYEGSTNFMNKSLIDMIQTKLCDSVNPFSDFFKLIVGGREVPEADFAVNDEMGDDIDTSVA